MIEVKNSRYTLAQTIYVDNAGQAHILTEEKQKYFDENPDSEALIDYYRKGSDVKNKNFGIGTCLVLAIDGIELAKAARFSLPLAWLDFEY